MTQEQLQVGIALVAALLQASVCNTVCGDGLLIAPEESCDDGTNFNIGNGCSSTCLSSLTGWNCTGGSNISATICLPICGDGLIIGNETCDDKNTISGDGCSSTCIVESGYKCKYTPSICT